MKGRSQQEHGRAPEANDQVCEAERRNSSHFAEPTRFKTQRSSRGSYGNFRRGAGAKGVCSSTVITSSALRILLRKMPSALSLNFPSGTLGRTNIPSLSVFTGAIGSRGAAAELL